MPFYLPNEEIFIQEGVQLVEVPHGSLENGKSRIFLRVGLIGIDYHIELRTLNIHIETLMKKRVQVALKFSL